MVKLTLKELRSITKIRNITDCKNMSKNQLTYLLIRSIKEFKQIKLKGYTFYNCGDLSSKNKREFHQ